MLNRNSCARSVLDWLPTLLLVVAMAIPLRAQQVPTAVSLRNASRAQLDSAATQLDRLGASTAYGAALRERARQSAAALRRRLSEGDFRPGDRVIIHIEGALTLDDTTTVLEGRRLPVKGFRQVTLDGVLRSELEARIRNELTDFVRNASVTVRPLMRVAVFGSVLQQGYFSVPSETTLDDLLTLAGGPGADANARAMIVQRGDTLLLTSDDVRAIIAGSRTIGAIGLEDGDALFVPKQAAPRDVRSALQTASFMISSLSILLFRF